MNASPPGDDGNVIPFELPTVWAEDMAAPLPALSWLSKSLTICRGRPTVLAGAGGCRKGWMAMELMLCAATGRPFLGRFDVGRLRSLYLDFEQGERATRERFQLLARGSGIELSKLGKEFGYRWRPMEALASRDDRGAAKSRDALCRQVDGFGLAVVDSARASSGGADENSTEASRAMDLMGGVSEKTGCTFLTIDHASPKAADHGRGNSQRGHTSKKDASQTLFVMSAEEDTPTLVTCNRSQLVAPKLWPKPFSFTLEEHASGVRLVEVDVERSDVSGIVELTARVIAYVTECPGCSGNDVIRAVGGNTRRVAALIKSLEASKQLIRDGGKLYVSHPDADSDGVIP